MNFFKRYWFAGLIAFIVCCFLLLFILLILSPKDDAKKRGFVKCTHEMIDNLSECDKAFYCSIKSIIDNTWCNVKVVAEGGRWFEEDSRIAIMSYHKFGMIIADNLDFYNQFYLNLYFHLF